MHSDDTVRVKFDGHRAEGLLCSSVLARKQHMQLIESVYNFDKSLVVSSLSGVLNWVILRVVWENY